MAGVQSGFDVFDLNLSIAEQTIGRLLRVALIDNNVALGLLLDRLSQVSLAKHMLAELQLNQTSVSTAVRIATLACCQLLYFRHRLPSV